MPKKTDTDIESPKTDPAPAPAVEWREYKLRKALVSSAVINSKYCRVQELGEGYQAIEVDGVDPMITEEARGTCLILAEKMAWTGGTVRRFVGSDGEETYR